MAAAARREVIDRAAVMRGVSHPEFVPRSGEAVGIVVLNERLLIALDDEAKAFHVRFDYRPFSDREPVMMILWMAERA